MDSYKYMFNNCRMPKKPSDYEAIFDPVKNNHVVVLRKNKFYVVDTIHNGKQLSTSELQHQFQRIIDQAGSSKGLPIGALTSDNRDKWTEVSFNWLEPENVGLFGHWIPLSWETNLRFLHPSSTENA